MREHDLSGVFLQRFLSEVKNGDDAMRRQRDEVGLRVRQAAEKEGRVWAMMWDVSGVPADQVEQGIMDDWLHLVRALYLLFFLIGIHGSDSNPFLFTAKQRENPGVTFIPS